MAGLYIRKATEADETREFQGKGGIGIFKFDEQTVGRGTFEPGWRWSTNVGPLEGTKSCQHAHAGYCLSGRMRIRMDDGEEKEFGAGDLVLIRPGHDAWVVGDETCVFLDFTGAKDYALEQSAYEGKASREERASVH